jgi:hypothetical protein
MNKKFLLIATLLAVSLAWVGCNRKAGKLNEHSTFKPPSGPVELKIKWPVGERIAQELDMKQTMETTVPGRDPIKQDMTMGQTYGLTVLQATPDGGHEVEMDFLSARMGLKMGDKTMLDYDSTKNAPEKNNSVASMFGKIVGTKIQFFLDATNGVERVEGVDEMMSRLSAGANTTELAPLKSMYNEGYFKQMMSANRFLPPTAVQPGDSWPAQLEYPMATMGTLVMDYTITFERWEMHGPRECARLEFQGTIQTKPDPKAKATDMSITVQDGNSSGVSWFDPELGITIDTTMNQDMKMSIRMPVNPKAKPGTPPMPNISMQMNQALKVKLASVK